MLHSALTTHTSGPSTICGKRPAHFQTHPAPSRTHNVLDACIASLRKKEFEDMKVACKFQEEEDKKRRKELDDIIMKDIVEAKYGLLTDADVTVCNIVECNDRVNKWLNAVFDDAVFDDAVFDDAVFDDAVFDDAVFDDAVFDDAVFDDADFDEADFDEAGDAALARAIAKSDEAGDAALARAIAESLETAKSDAALALAVAESFETVKSNAALALVVAKSDKDDEDDADADEDDGFVYDEENLVFDYGDEDDE
jgi:hypothetical protein